MLTADVEFALVQKDVYFGLQQGTSVLKEIRKEMGGIEQVEKLMGEGEEEKAFQQEVSELLEGKMSRQDEEDVEDELRALEAETLSTKTPGLPSAPETAPLPNAPATEIQSKSQNEEQREDETRQAVMA